MRRLREVADERGAAALVRDDGDLRLALCELEHRADEVPARAAEEPGGPDDPCVFACRCFPMQLRAPVRGERVGLIRFDVGLALGAVEDVIRRVRDEWCSDL